MEEAATMQRRRFTFVGWEASPSLAFGSIGTAFAMVGITDETTAGDSPEATPLFPLPSVTVAATFGEATPTKPYPLLEPQATHCLGLKRWLQAQRT